MPAAPPTVRDLLALGKTVHEAHQREEAALVVAAAIPLSDGAREPTKRQLEVLAVVARASSHEVAALELGLTVRGLDSSLTAARERLGVMTTLQAILLCQKAGLLP